MKIIVTLRANRGKIARFNSINSKIIGRKFINFGHDVDGLLPLNLLKANLLSANPLSNVKAKSNRSFLTMFANISQQHPLGDCQRNIWIIVSINTPTKPVK